MLDPIERDKALNRLATPIRLTQLGMLAERVVRALWPLASIVLLTLSMAMLGLQDHLSLPLFACVALAISGMAVAAGFFAIRRWRWPSREAARLRLDDSLSGSVL